MTPLMKAAMTGNRETVRALLDFGADPNKTDAEGRRPPLYAALQAGDAVCVSLLADVTNTGNIFIIETFTGYLTQDWPSVWRCLLGLQ